MGWFLAGGFSKPRRLAFLACRLAVELVTICTTLTALRGAHLVLSSIPIRSFSQGVYLVSFATVAECASAFVILLVAIGDCFKDWFRSWEGAVQTSVTGKGHMNHLD